MYGLKVVKAACGLLDWSICGKRLQAFHSRDVSGLVLISEVSPASKGAGINMEGSKRLLPTILVAWQVYDRKWPKIA
jgi:hypothetical protein